MKLAPAQLEAMHNTTGFIAALDQSGGSTPKTLQSYGIAPTEYSGDAQMYEQVHAMRTRIMTSPHFNCDNICAAILFENTINRLVENQPTAQYLWRSKQILPILKIDQGLADENNGVQLMKPISHLDRLLDQAIAHEVFATKMRSVIKTDHVEGIAAVVAQQISVAEQIMARNLVPIIEPEVDIHAVNKASAEALLRAALLDYVHTLSDGELVIFKLTLPETPNFYQFDHPNVLKVVALSGGYSRAEANRQLHLNHGMSASFSRALTEGLTVTQTDTEFNTTLGESIASIVAASRSE